MVLTTLATLAASETVKEAVKPVFSKFISPQLDSIQSWLKDRKISKKIELFEAEFIEYLSYAFASTEFMNVLIFPNEQIRIDDFYEPLSISLSNQKESYNIDNGNLDFLTKYKKIVIGDAAGMGKSTIAKWIMRQCINMYVGIPILVELKKITKLNSVLTEIFNQFGGLSKGLDEEFITKLLSLGKFIIIFDGFDEIAQDDIDFALSNISDFVSKANNNQFILTSRPDPVLTSFGNFKGFHIKALTKAQYSSIIYKCDKYSPEPVGEELVKDLQSRGRDILDFLSNPFLVTLLYNCYSYNKNIPVNKSAFYDEIYTALFKRHDLSKNKFERAKRSGLDIYNFRLVLRKLAFNSARIGVNDFSEDSLISSIKSVQESIAGLPSFSALAFCEDLIKQVPLMVRDGLHIKWSHKSLQDYFAAESICYNENKVRLIESLYKSESFYRNSNLFDFIVELDYGLVRENVLYDVLLDFRAFVQQVREVSPFLTEEEIIFRASVLFSGDVVLTRISTPEQISFVSLREVTDSSVNGFTSHKVYINGNQGMVMVTSSKRSSLFNMILKKKKEDIFSTVSYKPSKGDYDLSSFLEMGAELVSLSDDIILKKDDANFQEVITNIIKENYGGTILNYDKAMKALENIEGQKQKQNADDNLLF